MRNCVGEYLSPWLYVVFNSVLRWKGDAVVLSFPRWRLPHTWSFLRSIILLVVSLVDVMHAASFCTPGAGSPLSQTLHCLQSLFAGWLWWAPPALPLAVPSGHHLLEGPTADAGPTCPSLRLSPGATVYLSQVADSPTTFQSRLAWAQPALAVPGKAHSQLLCREERRRDPEVLRP